MSLQSVLDQQAIDKLPAIKSLIARAKPFEANQMTCRALREILNTVTPLDEMNADQVEIFTGELVHIFKHYEWIG